MNRNTIVLGAILFALCAGLAYSERDRIARALHRPAYRCHENVGCYVPAFRASGQYGPQDHDEWGPRRYETKKISEHPEAWCGIGGRCWPTAERCGYFEHTPCERRAPTR
jgi:hypothetical protein